MTSSLNSDKLKKYEAKVDSFQFLIEEDLPEVGWYLYVYKNGVCIKDFLQDDLNSAMRQANEEFSVPRSYWKQV